MMSAPSRSALAALRRWTSVRAGQSVPTTSTGPPAAAVAASMRAPKSPSGCGLSVMRERVTSLRNALCVLSGAHHRVTGPTLAARAVATARSVRRSCSTAAACAPIVGIRRVLTNPGTGALARMAMETELLLGGGIAVLPCQARGVGTEEVSQSQTPHQKDRAQRSIFLPTPGRGCNAGAKAERTANTFEISGQSNVFHQGNWRKSPSGIECDPCDEQSLIASGDPC